MEGLSQGSKQVHVPRTCTAVSPTKAVHKYLCLLLDASSKAIGAAAYLKAVQENGLVEVGFIMRKAKSHQSEPKILELELCATVLAVQMLDLIKDELDLKLDATKFYTDSKAVLGYICNDSKRFYAYGPNRVQQIRQSSKPGQWHCVRSVEKTLTMTLTMLQDLYRYPASYKPLGSLDPPKGTESGRILIYLNLKWTCLKEAVLPSDRFQCFSTFAPLVRGVAFLIRMANSFKHSN